MTGQVLVDTGPIVAILLESDEHHLANREGIEIMFTLDRRDFGVLRLAHRKKLRLIP